MFGVNLDLFYFAHVAFGKYRSINMIYYLLFSSQRLVLFQ